MERRYQSAVVGMDKLSEVTVQAMATLYLQNFDASSDARFRVDLMDKDEAILLLCGQDRDLVGFTTLKVFEREWMGSPVRIVYSGDTIVSPEHWGQQELAFSWIARIGQIKQQAPDTPLYWFLLVKGHRTFKYLSVFGKSFHPHWALDRHDLRSLGDQLAQEKFGDDYNSTTGVVEFCPSRGHLKTSLAQATAQERTKPATQFFLERNPGYREGHELVCICELELHNMKPMTARVFQRALEEAVCL